MIGDRPVHVADAKLGHQGLTGPSRHGPVAPRSAGLSSTRPGGVQPTHGEVAESRPDGRPAGPDDR